MQLTIRPGTVQLNLSPTELQELTRENHLELPLGSSEDRLVIAVDVQQPHGRGRESSASIEQMSVESQPLSER